ncbi:tyrosine-protein kinase receptor Tie-1-like [Branchiostoma floridae]|uniref:Tyrosine-protein kinase receptor Tie-1-like n=2 Tax=Branchiostoma floridae TaxID=7739 RepID=A0A9J7KI76_BRAFL|nr:tyrosine-protein kinase receptor Tie-1-like [Branchiostoma floridae]
MDGDPYHRFDVTKNCTIVVANPLYLSVQSLYHLKVRSGQRNTSVRVDLTEVEGYPPVYNETCETPVNPNDFTLRRNDRNTLVNVEYLKIGLQPVGCPVGKYGFRCHKDCICRNGARCHGFNGACKCPPGWKGVACDIPKKDVIFTTTPTDPGDIYTSANVMFHCADGWFGKDCSIPCLNGHFGWRCQQVCTCKNNATCHNVDGSCACVTPWTGPDCGQLLQTIRVRDEPLLESLVPLGSLVILVAIVAAILYKTGILACSAPDRHEEDMILFELRKMEQDLAQSLQPGWLGRWEKKIRHLTPGPLIGEGMFGQVRRAQLSTHGRRLDVAAKTVRVEDSQSYRDFYREAAILVAVHQQRNGDGRKSHIIQLVGLITKSVEKYILLEYAPKGDLLGFLRRIGNINEEDLLGNLLGYAVHIARALQELERLRIAHRDVAARNVLITADDVAKLADFGLARDVYATTQYVRANRPGVDELLPLKWMALESIETGEYTCESDVWSFGVLLWEIATLGKDPCYDGRTQLSFLQMVGILRQGIRMKRPPGCPEDLYRLMRACWCDVPATRPTPEGMEKRLMQQRQALLPHEAIEMETLV